MPSQLCKQKPHEFAIWILIAFIVANATLIFIGWYQTSVGNALTLVYPLYPLLIFVWYDCIFICPIFIGLSIVLIFIYYSSSSGRHLFLPWVIVVFGFFYVIRYAVELLYWMNVRYANAYGEVGSSYDELPYISQQLLLSAGLVFSIVVTVIALVYLIYKSRKKYGLMDCFGG